MRDTDIYTNLQHRLITNAFEHGQRLRAEVIKDEYGVSASTVREALFRLSAEGLVVFLEQRGFRVPEKSRRVINELAHVRILLEQEGTALSIEYGGVEWEARLTAAHHQLSHIESRIHGAKDPLPFVDIWFRSEEEFHDTLISACGSRVLLETHKMIYRRFRQQVMVEDRVFDFISANIDHHAEILRAALSGDSALAGQKIHHHLSRHLEPEPAASSVG